MNSRAIKLQIHYHSIKNNKWLSICIQGIKSSYKHCYTLSAKSGTINRMDISTHFIFDFFVNRQRTGINNVHLLLCRNSCCFRIERIKLTAVKFNSRNILVIKRHLNRIIFWHRYIQGIHEYRYLQNISTLIICHHRIASLVESLNSSSINRFLCCRIIYEATNFLHLIDR